MRLRHAASLALAAFCLDAAAHARRGRRTGGEDRLAWLRAREILGLIPYLLVLFIVTFIDSTIHNGYFVLTGSFLAKVGISPENIMPVMSIGQVAEIADDGRPWAGASSGSAGG